MLELETNKIYQGHVLDVLKTFPDESVDTIITSSPYWALRDYSTVKAFQTKEDADIWSKITAKKWTELTNNPNVEFVANPSRYDEKKDVWIGSVSALCIWDDPGNCEHEFNIIEKEIKNNKNENFNERWGNESGKSKQEESQQIILKSGFCKCGAWKGQLGLEPDFNMFIDHLIQIFDECKRILKKEGSLWVNLGDTYYTKSGGSFLNDAISNTAEKSGIHKANNIRDLGLLPSKTLVKIPDRFVIAMVDRGWICRNEIHWHKPNVMPSSVKDRFTTDFEKFFFFVKSRKYYFEQQFEPIDIESLNPKKFGKNNPKGHNRQGLGKWQEKYADLYEEAKHRQGMNKTRGEKMVKKRNLPNQKEFVDYMRSGKWKTLPTHMRKSYIIIPNKLRIKWISEDLEIPESTVEHWFRYDDSGFSFPSIEDWVKFQKIYNTDKFSELVEFWEDPDSIKSHSVKLNQAFFGNPPTNYRRMGNTTKLGSTHSGYYNEDGSLRVSSELGRNKRTTWSINTRPFPDAHFAVFPEELIETPIKACCPEGGIVLDPFMGAGTSGVVAKKQKKKWIGIELNPEYIEMALARIKKVAIYDTLEAYF